MMLKRIFVDIDGTIARFHDNVNYLEKMYEKNFFRELKPFANMVEALREFNAEMPNAEMYILSATIDGEPPYCADEKMQWIKEYLPFIDDEHVIFPPIGANKCDYIPNGVQSDDVLLDDYNKNLEEWAQAGGLSVKCKNNINHRGRNGNLWLGKLIDNSFCPSEISEDLRNIITGETSIKYEGQIRIDDRIIHSRILSTEEMLGATFVKSNIEGIKQCQIMKNKLAKAGLQKDIQGQIDFHYSEISEAIKTRENGEREYAECKNAEKFWQNHIATKVQQESVDEIDDEMEM